VEICGSTSSGKTELLLQIMINIIMPKKYDSLDLNGLEGCVIFIDTSYKFSMIRFGSLLEQHFNTVSNGQNIDTKVSEGFVKDCLKRFFKITCSSSIEMIVSLLSLELFFQSTPNAYLLVVDDIFAYYWIDDLEAGNNRSAKNRNIEHVYNILMKFVKDHRINVITTKLDMNPSVALNGETVKKYQIQRKSSTAAGDDIYLFSKRTFGKLVQICNYRLTSEGVYFE